MGLEALAARGWKGHLVAECWMEKKGGEVEEGSEIIVDIPL